MLLGSGEAIKAGTEVRRVGRLAAMQAADKSLEARREALRYELNQRRQDAITTELLDVIAGYEALSQKAGDVPADE